MALTLPDAFSIYSTLVACVKSKKPFCELNDSDNNLNSH